MSNHSYCVKIYTMPWIAMALGHLYSDKHWYREEREDFFLIFIRNVTGNYSCVMMNDFLVKCMARQLFLFNKNKIRIYILVFGSLISDIFHSLFFFGLKNIEVGLVKISNLQSCQEWKYNSVKKTFHYFWHSMKVFIQ